MERELYRQICRRLDAMPVVFSYRQRYDDRRILQVYLWAVLHDRPVCWACQGDHWPLSLRRSKLPSQSQMSRRLRTLSLQQLLQRLYAALREELPRSALKFIDGKPLATGGCSKDPDATCGHGAGLIQRGYKLLCISDATGPVDAWFLSSMHVPEHHTAAALLERWHTQATLLGDNAFDKNALYELAAEKGLHLIGAFARHAKALGHRRHSPHRIAAFALQQTPGGQELLACRSGIERTFGHLCSFGGGLGPLPAWVRRPHRVALWVTGKLIIDLARRIRLKERQEVA